MSGAPHLKRRAFLEGIAVLATPMLVLGCNRLFSCEAGEKGLQRAAEWLSAQPHRLVGQRALAREYAPGDVSPEFRTNGSTLPRRNKQWLRQAANGFVDWRLPVEGEVRTPRSFSLAQLRAFPARTQITRHDCVEGWSAIGQWRGVPLGTVLDRAGLTDKARFVVFHCADTLIGQRYYESIDLIEAFHPQTILAYDMNGTLLPHRHGAPIRLRVERQLGYKQAKFVSRIEVVSSLRRIKGGQGGLWEDIAGYAWYAGI